MKSKLIVVSLMFILVFNYSNAQTKFEIGVEGGLTYLKYKIVDPGNNLKNVPTISAMPGINFRYNTTKSFYYEIAATALEYVHGIRLKQQSGYSTINSDKTIMFPFRAGYNLKLDQKFTLVPVMGMTTAIITVNNDGESLSTGVGNEYNYEYERRELGKDIFFLCQGGLALEFRFVKRVKASLGFNYYQGLSKFAIYDVEYSINQAPIQKATQSGKGSFTNVQLGFRYLFRKTKNY